MSKMNHIKRSAHNQKQRKYFDSIERPRLALRDTRYVQAHLERMFQGANLAPSQRILEIGAGLGKFTLPLVQRGLSVVANDLSPVLLERLQAATSNRIATLCSDVMDIAENSDDYFDRIIGFFVLHHLLDFESVFASLTKVMAPGGRIAFCEPVAWNPLYYAQIFFTAGMDFAGEPSLASMRPAIILPAMRAAGFIETNACGYGYFPPIIKNTWTGDQIEQWLGDRRWVPFPHAFQLFTATFPS